MSQHSPAIALWFTPASIVARQSQKFSIVVLTVVGTQQKNVPCAMCLHPWAHVCIRQRETQCMRNFVLCDSTPEHTFAYVKGRHNACGILCYVPPPLSTRLHTSKGDTMHAEFCAMCLHPWAHVCIRQRETQSMRNWYKDFISTLRTQSMRQYGMGPRDHTICIL